MKKRYTETLLFLSRLSHSSNTGFAMAFVLIAGGIMAATGVAMLFRSSSETEKVAVQAATAKGKTTSEVAVARIQYLLGKYPFLAEKSLNDWQNADVESQIKAQIKTTCDGRSLTETQINAKVQQSKGEIGQYVATNSTESEYQWLQMDPSNPDKGQFRFTEYAPAIAGQKMGQLTIEAKANAGNDLKEAPTKLVVKIPLNETPPDIQDSPGLWVEKASGVDDILAAHVWIGSGGDDCSVTDDDAKIAEINELVFGDPSDSNNKGGLEEAITDGEVSADTSFKPAKVAAHKFPDKTKLDETYAEKVTGAGVTPININTAFVNNINKTGGNNTVSYNPLPTVATWMNGVFDKGFNHLFGNAAVASTSSCGTQVSSTLNGTDLNVFPRPGDTATRTETTHDGQTICVYDYEITKDLKNVGVVVRTLNAEGKRQRVIFHLHGNINKNAEIAHVGNEDLTGTAKIKDTPDCTGSCKPVDFQIWGHTTTSVCLNGNKKLHTFLWSPLAGLGVAGTGDAKGGLNGTAFVNNWDTNCSSNSSSGAHVVQTGEWLDLGLETPEITPPMTVGQPANIKTKQFQ
ncbi:hypothetical protein [Crocosphaera chwakensis]|uniref:Uncharacterized protein n=1 Tax=Crocosphaera chwakensis CCY0110 TaxID=391612 RepID=A3IKW9_9CHRO|nr:hypothetical protein [Crocosphaera chwakensis]EAZ92838.1 hypothetical protein CY0110_22117 [Crocosphaera chwakensis CCY0110]